MQSGDMVGVVKLLAQQAGGEDPVWRCQCLCGAEFLAGQAKIWKARYRRFNCGCVALAAKQKESQRNWERIRLNHLMKQERFRRYMESKGTPAPIAHSHTAPPCSPGAVAGAPRK